MYHQPASTDTLAYQCCRRKFPWLSRQQFQDIYMFTESSIDDAGNYLMDLVCTAFLDNLTIAVSPDRTHISYRLQLDYLNAGERFIILPDSDYGLIHVFRNELLLAEGGIPVDYAA